EQLSVDMTLGTVAGRSHVDFSRVGPGMGDELGNSLSRHRGVHLGKFHIALRASWCDALVTQPIVKNVCKKPAEEARRRHVRCKLQWSGFRTMPVAASLLNYLINALRQEGMSVRSLA